MFRECYFEYAGQSSQPYNLMLCYASNSNSDFDSGGKFDLKTDNLPYFHETLLYGKDYSAQPLEFEIEILNLHGYIPLEQMIEIKNWLFGQEGWQTFRCLDDRQDFILKCIFEPGEDIIDGTGYRGFRCTLRNASPFWYGDEIEIVAKNYWTNTVLINGNNYNVFSIDIPNDNCVDAIIYPTIDLTIDKTNGDFLAADVKEFRLLSCDATTITEGLNVSDYPNTSEIRFDISYLGNKGDANAHDNVSVNTRYVIIESEKSPSLTIPPIVTVSEPLPIFKIKYGTNILRVRYGWNYTKIAFKYTPLYRMGAF